MLCPDSDEDRDRAAVTQIVFSNPRNHFGGCPGGRKKTRILALSVGVLPGHQLSLGDGSSAASSGHNGTSGESLHAKVPLPPRHMFGVAGHDSIVGPGGRCRCAVL